MYIFGDVRTAVLPENGRGLRTVAADYGTDKTDSF